MITTTYFQHRKHIVIFHDGIVLPSLDLNNNSDCCYKGIVTATKLRKGEINVEQCIQIGIVRGNGTSCDEVINCKGCYVSLAEEASFTKYISSADMIANKSSIQFQKRQYLMYIYYLCNNLIYTIYHLCQKTSILSHPYWDSKGNVWVTLASHSNA